MSNLLPDNRTGYLDGWRGLAILFVLFDHFLQIPFINIGRFGVDIFFVLSGMLMSKILFINRMPILKFYKRRISRVFPTFFIFISGFYLASYLFNLSDESENYLYTLFFLRSYLPVTPDLWNTGIPVGHMWSLNVQEHCYILLGFITLIGFFRKFEFIPLLLMGGAVVFLQYLYVTYPGWETPNYQIKTEIVASHLLISSGYFLIKKHFERFVLPWMPLLTFILGLFCYSKYAHEYAAWFFSPFLLAFTVNHLNQIPKTVKSFLENKNLQLLGLWSYSIYIWQQPFYFYLVKYEPAMIITRISLIAFVIALGFLFYYYFENPVRKYLNNNW